METLLKEKILLTALSLTLMDKTYTEILLKDESPLDGLSRKPIAGPHPDG